MDSPLAHEPTLAVASAQGVADRLAEGMQVGDYAIDRFLGGGAMGDVYAARHPVIGKRVAIKVLKRELASDPEAAERFIREARAVNQVDHPNVIDVFNIGRLADGRLYLVMDLVDGRSLRRVLEDGPMTAEAALAVLDQIASALDAAHGKGVVHRDLKPDNVMVVESDPPKVFVLDFGIAKLVAEGQPGGTLTGKGAWLGTPGYMAPEQWSADGAGPASDRYALGVMAYELLSGVLPFKASTLPQMMEQHFRAPVPALTTKRGKVAHSATIDPVLARAMAKQPEKRFATAKELVGALRAAAGGRRVERGKRSPILPAVAGAGVLGIAIGGYVIIRGGGDASEGRQQGAMQPGDTITIQLVTVPKGAKVLRDNRLAGQTPLDVAVRPGEKLAVTFHKPGYRPASAELVASEASTISRPLEAITDFEGIWVMPDEQLRGLKRVGEHVDVYKHESAKGTGEFFRKFSFIEPPDGVSALVFAADVELALGGHTDASCQVKQQVQYRYDSATGRLEVAAEKVEWKRRDHGCTILERVPGPPLLLARVDLSEARWSQPPVGVPRDNNVPRKGENFGPPPDAKELQVEARRRAAELRRAEEAKQQEARRSNQLNNDNGAVGDNEPPQPQAPPQEQAKEPPARQQPKDQVQQQQAPRGDSQQANPPQAPPPRGDSQQVTPPPVQRR